MKNIEAINPDGLMKSPAFSQAILTQGKGKTLYIGGQNAVNAKGELVGAGNIQAQTDQVMQNIQTILTACHASFSNVVKLTIYLLQGQDVMAAFQASQKYLQGATQPPTVSVLMVAGLGQPGYFLEVDAVAFIPE